MMTNTPPPSKRPHVQVIGGGLAGCEVALQLANRDIDVSLYEMKPHRRTPAQHTDLFAELVCSNSFRSADLNNAIGLLKWEMDQLGSQVMDVAHLHEVPAGSALAVDRNRFSAELTDRVSNHPRIKVIHEVVEHLFEGEADAVVVCTGPLTDSALAKDIAEFAGVESLYFYDAIAPIIDAESINWDIVWKQSRYDRGETADYANIPLSEKQYLDFINDLITGDKVTPKAFEEAKYFEGCLPIEVMADRGPLTLAHGPLKPVGLTNPNSDERPFAVAQLRMENREGSAWNMVGFQTRLKYPEQKRIFKSLPGLENAEFLRFGSIHRNTYLHAPSLLHDNLHTHKRPDLYFAGQITGVEGYVESTACGLLIALSLAARLKGETFEIPPMTTAFGALYRHLRHEGIYSAYVPSNLNWSFFEPMPKRRREKKREKRARMSARAQDALKIWKQAHQSLF